MENEQSPLTPEDELDAILRTAIPKLPESVGGLMLRDPAVLEALQLPTCPLAGVMGERFDRGQVLAALRSLVNGSPTTLTSLNGQLTIDDMKIAEDGAGIFETDAQIARFPNVGLLSESPQRRKAVIDRIVAQGRMSRERERAWRSVTRAGALDDDTLLKLETEIDATPEAVLGDIQEGIEKREAQFKDLVPVGVGYCKGLLSLAALPPTLAEFKEAWLNAASGEKRVRLPHLLKLSAPLSLLEGSIVARACAGLSGAARAKLARDLGRAADPFSVLAAFQISTAYRTEKGMGKLGVQLATRLLNPEEPVIATGGADFAAACSITYAILGRHRTLAAWPPYARRLAVLMHASHIVRILGDSNVERPAFHETVARAFGPQARLAELYEARVAPVFHPQFLGPAYLHGIVFRRATEAMKALPETEHPPEWEAGIAVAAESARESGSSVFYLAPCPLDEFEEDWAGLIMVAPEHVGHFHEAFEPNTDAAIGINQLYKIVAAFEFAEEDRVRLSAALPPFLKRLEGEEFALFAEAALLLAARWRDRPMADSVLGVVLDRHRQVGLADPVAVPRLVFEGANSVKQKQEWLDRTADLARQFAYAYRPGAGVGYYVRALDIMADIDPNLGASLARAKSFALLAYGRLPTADTAD